MLIYSTHCHPRFQYACEILMENAVGHWSITNDKSQFENYQGVRIEYGTVPSFDGALFIENVNWLWNDSISNFEVCVGHWDDLPTLFPTNASIPFDIFSSIFYLISRYEEYLPFQADQMGRFTASQSIAGKAGFLRRPIIDLWRQHFEAELTQRWPTAEFTKRPFKFLSTIDVDSAFAYKHKGLKRTLGGIAKDVLKGDLANLKTRIKTLLGSIEDKYETYNYISNQCERFKVANRYFFLLADFDQYDKNVPHRSKALNVLIQNLKFKAEVGIHPGVASNDDYSKLLLEKSRLEKILHEKCYQARQHYLMLNFPKTYRAYLDAEISNDYSMGFADDVGFRAGTSRPFFWFDLERNMKTELTIFPFAAMDTTLKNYLRLNIEQAITVTAKMMDEVKSTGGNFIALWHNETLSESDGWKGWREVWEATLEYATQKNDRI